MPETFFQDKFVCNAITDNDLDTQSFLKSAEGLSTFFDLIGSAMKIVKKDMEGNIKKIQDSYRTDPNNMKTVRNLLKVEKETGASRRDPSGTVGLLWLKRGLEYITEFIVALVEDYRANICVDTVSDVARRAYDRSLKRHHTWIMQKTFAVVSYASPRRTVLLKKMSSDLDEVNEEVVKDFQDFINRLRPILSILNGMLIEYGIETPPEQ